MLWPDISGAAVNLKAGKHSSNSEVSSPGKRKRLTKEWGRKKKKKVPRWDEDSSSYTHHFLSTGAEAAAEARHSSPASESTPLSSSPIYMSKTQVCSVWGIPGSGWESVTGEKLVRLRGNFFKPKTPPAALSRLESSGEFYFFPLCPC